MDEISTLIRNHHERWDGGGYPDGISGDSIPIESRILAAADSLDAMTHQRLYRSAISLEAAKVEIAACSGSQFDPAVAKALLDILDREAPSRVAAEDPDGADAHVSNGNGEAHGVRVRRRSTRRSLVGST